MSIPGIIQATALSLLVDMPEAGSLDQSRVASLAYRAPQAMWDPDPAHGSPFC